MGQVIEILTGLGINSSVFFQFGIFFIAFISMKYIVFTPYLNAYNERQKRTVGGQEEAESPPCRSGSKRRGVCTTSKEASLRN
jgi:hypothetical protein